jgi:class 3 adenylate cyclase
LSSTRQQARLLLAHSGAAEDWLDDVLRIPPVVVYTGHMIDAPGRAVPRFPAEREGAVRDQVRAFLEQIQPVAAYGSAACGADILCLECVQELGGELHIVLPFPAEQFRQVSVDLWPGSDWGSRFERLLASTEKVFTISEHMPPSGTSTFEYANVIMTGLARLRADVLQTSVHGLAVWDGQGAGGAGGTGTVVDMWRRYGVPLEHIDLGTGDAGHGADGITGQYAVSGEPSPFEYTIKAMLFADAVGYSRLNEDQIPLFFEHYLGTIAAYNAQTPHRAQHVETAGDGMYMVFDDPADAGHYALGLSELLNSVDWERCALPANLSARIALHCGPVFAGQDPITGTPIYSGTHTSRTARIEPITPPGQVYASGAFAAIAAARNIEGLRFSYIGRTQLAKRYGALALYHVKHP